MSRQASWAAFVVWAMAACSGSRAETVSYHFDDLLNTPHTQIEFKPYDIGVRFDSIESITFELAGEGTTHTWEVRHVSGELEYYHTSNLWSVDLYGPPANHAVQSFVGSGPFDFDLSLFELGDWDQLESGLFSLRPVPSGAFLAIYYLDLVESTAQITLTEATMHVTGRGASFVADGDGDGDVDGADFLHWQRGDAAMLSKWHATFGAGAVSSVANVPEPTTGLLIVLAAMGTAALRRRSLGR